MSRVDFTEWVAKRDQELAEARTALYGGRENDDIAPFSMADRMQDNQTAEGDWEQKLERLCMTWAKMDPGPGKDSMKQKVDDYAQHLIQIGNNHTRVFSILNRALAAPGKGTFIKTAARHGGTWNR